MFLSRRLIQRAQADSVACLLCQWRTFSTFQRHFAEQKGAASPIKKIPPPPSALQKAPKAYGKKITEFTPKPLDRPIGLPKPPKAGENNGIDSRTWRQRRDDFLNYDKHLARRTELTHQISKPYFRDWSNMRLHKGKSFLAPPRLFKADRALFFPNLHGQTLLKDKLFRDTTPVLQNKISVVSVFSSAWAENQAATFVSPKHNPELHEVIKGSEGAAQLIQINLEEDALKAWLVKLYMPSLRKRLEVQNWGRYFLIRKGMTDDIRDSIGLLNSKVGYTYLLDGECKIRWAGSGDCEVAEERESLVKGVRRLLEDSKLREKPTPAPLPQKRILEGQLVRESPQAAAPAF